ncbi:MAG TPA: phosphate acyltransferase PlsX [Gaiellaceae bacterium]|nr:phosphate acyltransferase PlsX [Gaiellaceae bacterium]
MAPVRVAVDAMGGDRAPEEIVAGALAAASPDVAPVLYGPRDVLEPLAGGLEIVHADQVVAMDDKPSEAVREKRGSSMFLACRAVAEGEAAVVVSAGNTGAMLAAALVELRRLPDVHRPGIAVPLPAIGGVSVLIDAGANADARPEHLVQFAHMGSVFAGEIAGAARPTVALLSIGEEPEKGNRLVREAHAELAAEPGLDFIGNVEGRDLLRKAADVVVCDGFTGNMALKLLEGTIRTTLEAFREEITASTRGKVGGLLIRPAARALRTRLDPDTYGGAYLLGLRGLVVIAHGNSSSTAIANAIRYGARGVVAGVVDRVADRLAAGVGEAAAP